MPLALLFPSLWSLILPIQWLGESGVTYTIETSSDMFSWSSLAVVVEGRNRMETVALDIPGSRGFARYRASNSGDSNNNGLPDKWEWECFGYLDVDASDDPDHDGLDNWSEYREGTDPLDYFNGEGAILNLANGAYWIVEAGTVSPQAISAYLKNPNGEPLTNAPVAIRITQGEGTLETNEQSSARHLNMSTDSLGRIHPSVFPVHFRAPDDETLTRIELVSGKARRELTIRSVTNMSMEPPREFETTIAPGDALHFSWRGSISGVENFFIEEQNSTGNWEKLIEVASSELQPVDPVTGKFQLTVERTLNP